MRVLILLALVAVATSTVYFQETFDDSWADRWTVSDWKQSDGTAGEWTHTAGPFYGDAEKSKGICTSQDARFYAISSKMSEAIGSVDKDLVIQFQVRHPQRLDCGGGYIKLLPSGLDQSDFQGSSDYGFMFGPDICGSSNKRIHAIINFEGENYLHEETIPCETDRASHVYTWEIKADGTYAIYVDGEERQSGKTLEGWKILPAKQIKDPEQSKPADWVDEAMIDDSEDTKPENWDQPKMIVDPEAEKPEDWDDDMDGEWEAPMVDNPDYKGEWAAKRIPNPDYKGPWEHPMIDNPEYDESKGANVAKIDNLEYVGFELWQVKAGSIFDNIIITDNLAEAKSFMDETYGALKEAETEMLNKLDEEERAAALAEAEAEEVNDDEDYEDQEEEEEEEEDDEEEEAAAHSHDEL